MQRHWDEEEALGQSAALLAECGPRGQTCWALQVVLDEVIQSVGPWWLAHFLETTTNEAAASALQDYLKDRWPTYAELVDRLIETTHWTRETEELARDLGED